MKTDAELIPHCVQDQPVKNTEHGFPWNILPFLLSKSVLSEH